VHSPEGELKTLTQFILGLFVPIIALAALIVYRKAKKNYWEHLVGAIYHFCVLLIISMVLIDTLALLTGYEPNGNLFGILLLLHFAQYARVLGGGGFWIDLL